MIALRLERLAIGYRSDCVRDIELCVEAGTLNLLIGQNGSGKTTLLKTLAGILPPRCGSLSWFGTAFSPRQLSRRVAFIFSERVCPPRTSVREFVGYGRIPYLGFLNRIRLLDRALISAALLRIGLEEVQHQWIETLSDGQYQKALIARALVQETEVIVMDEPFVHLDFFAKRALQQLLEELLQEGKTLIAATHDLSPWSTKADNLWWIDDSRFHNFQGQQIYNFLNPYWDSGK